MKNTLLSLNTYHYRRGGSDAVFLIIRNFFRTFSGIPWHLPRPLHDVMSGTGIRQKTAKKQCLHGINAHLSQILMQLARRVVAVQRSPFIIQYKHTATLHKTRIS